MLVSYFSPLAPAAVLLLGAFILSVVVPWLPKQWRTQRRVQLWGAPVLVGLAGLTLLGTRLTFGPDAGGEGQQLLSGWNFSTVESAAALSVRLDGPGLAFLILSFLILLAATLALSLSSSGEQGQQANFPDDINRWTRAAGGLALGAAASALFISVNSLTIAYAVLLFDGLAASFWLRRGQTELSVAHLFLGIFTAGGLGLLFIDAAGGAWLFGLALWLRLGFFPLIETNSLTRRPDDDTLVYVALSLAVGLFLAMRGTAAYLPALLVWLSLATMLLSGLLAWLADERTELLLRLVTTLALLSLLAGALTAETISAFAVGLILSLAALWLTPRLGKPRLSEGAWSWPYLPAVGASLTLLGLPGLLNWPTQAAVFQTLFNSEQILGAVVSILAEALALSGLVRYWFLVWQGIRQNGRHAVASTVIMVPFLIPGLAPFILAIITRSELPRADFEQSMSVYLALVATITAAAALGYYRTEILSGLKISPAALVDWVNSNRLRTRWENPFIWAGKLVLRVEVLLEGQHYVGWALFTALVGVLIILLGR